MTPIGHEIFIETSMMFATLNARACKHGTVLAQGLWGPEQ
jgi:hypothetical protein